MISRNDPASVPVAVAAGVLLAAAAAGACRALWHRTAALLAAGRQARRLPGAGQVVVIDDEAADAYTLPGWPCRIVVTAGMMRALSHPERQVLLAHERAHASGLHHLFTTAARLAAAANPLLRPVAAAVAGPPPWKPPASCTACSTTPAPSARPDPAAPRGRFRDAARRSAVTARPVPRTPHLSSYTDVVAVI